MKRKLAALLIIFNIFACLCLPFLAYAGSHSGLNVVFTGNLHSHLENFAFISDYIKNERSVYPDALALDCGNFSIGAAPQVLFAAEAPELRLLGASGYDAIALGAHEYSYGEDTVKQMLLSAKNSNETLPAVLCDEPEKVIPASDRYETPVKRYSLIKRGGYSVAVFSVCDTDSFKIARNIADEVKKLYSPDLVVCLFGADGLTSDYYYEKKLAADAPGIDLIISANEKVVYDEPLYSCGAFIVGTGKDGLLAGQITFDIDNGKISCKRFVYTDKSSYKNEDASVAAAAAAFIEKTDPFFESYGYSGANAIVAKSDYSLTGYGAYSKTASLNKLIADAFVNCIKNKEEANCKPVDIALVSTYSVRGGINEGDITVSDLFAMLPLGDSAHTYCGSPLCSFYIRGDDIIDLCEADISISPSVPELSLYISGVSYSANTSRIKFNRVYSCMLSDDYSVTEINEEKLYRVVSSLYTAESLKRIKEGSFGILSVTLRDENGNEIKDTSEIVIRDSEGKEILQWQALADDLPVFRSENGAAILSDAYSYEKYVNKTILSGFDKNFFTGLNAASWIVFGSGAFALLFIIAIILIVIAAVRRHKKKVRAMIALEKGEDDEEYEEEE